VYSTNFKNKDKEKYVIDLNYLLNKLVLTINRKLNWKEAVNNKIL